MVLRGVLGIGADQHHPADLPGVHPALGLGAGGIEAAHEAQLEHQLRMGLHHLLRLLALGHVDVQGLFTEDVLAVLHGDPNLLHMEEGRRDDGNAVQLRVRAHLRKIRVGMGDVQLLRHRPEPFLIHITDGVEGAAGKKRGQIFRMLITQTAQANGADFDRFHNGSLFPYFCYYTPSS